MKKESLPVLAQLFHALKDAVLELEKYEKKKKFDKVLEIKREILEINSKMQGLI